MSKRSNKKVGETLTTKMIIAREDRKQEVVQEVLDRKIAIATEGFTTNKFCELVLKDRNRLSIENALTICDYVIAMKREINLRLNTVRTTIQFLSELSKAAGVEKKFVEMTRDNILSYLDKCRKLENEDPLHKWIGSYDVKRVIITRFFKWLYYPGIDSPKKRSELSAAERKPECIMGIAKLKRKEVSCYKPSDLWTQENDLLFLKWVTNKRDRRAIQRNAIPDTNLDSSYW